MAGEWTTAKIGDCFELVGGYAFKSGDFIESGVPVIKIKNVKANRMLLDDLSYVDPEFLKSRADKVIQKGDLLITMSGNRFDGSSDTWVGKVAQFGEDRPFMLNQRVGILRPKQGAEIDRRFFAFSLSSNFYQKEFIAIATSSGGQANLSPSQILGSPIEYPTLAEQKAIALVLGALDDKIELNRRMNGTLEAMARALFQSWFVDFDPVRAKLDGRIPTGLDHETAALFPDSFQDSPLGHIPKGWEIGSILRQADLLSGGTPKTDVPAYWNGDVPWASAKDVSQCGEAFLVSTERTITKRGVDESSTKIIPANATVVVARGATTGRLTMFGHAMAMNQTCYGLKSKFDAPFALYCNARHFIERLVQGGHGSIFDTITTSTFEATDVLLAPKEVLLTFDEHVTPLFQQVRANLNQSRTLATLRDTLLRKLLSGELSVDAIAYEVTSA